MPFQTGNKFGTGRPKGSLNKLTQDSRQALASVLSGEIEKIGEYLDALNPEKRIDAISKLLPYFLPRLTSGDLMIESTERPIPFGYTKLSDSALKEVLNLIHETDDFQDRNGTPGNF